MLNSLFVNFTSAYSLSHYELRASASKELYQSFFSIDMRQTTYTASSSDEYLKKNQISIIFSSQFSLVIEEIEMIETNEDR